MPLTLGKSGDDLTLQWGASCAATDSDYEIYEGTIGAYTTHSKRLCTTAGSLAVTLTTDFGSHYYLVVRRNVSFEGSYGHNSSGVERPVGLVTCSTRMIGACP